MTQFQSNDSQKISKVESGSVIDKVFAVMLNSQEADHEDTKVDHGVQKPNLGARTVTLWRVHIRVREMLVQEDFGREHGSKKKAESDLYRRKEGSRVQVLLSCQVVL